MSEPNAPLPGWKGGDGTAAYLDKALTYRPGVWESAEPSGLARLAKQSIPAGALLLVIFVGIAELAHISSVILFAISATIGACALLILFSRLVEPIGEWSVVLPDRATAAESVYSAVAGKLSERKLPVNQTSMRRIAIGFGTVNRLVLVNDHYRAVISVSPYGTGLYLGWSMTRTRRGWTVLRQLLAHTRSVNDTGHHESSRALRETIHAICLDGLSIAIERIEVPLPYGFPHGLPPLEHPPSGVSPAPLMKSPTDDWPVAIYLQDGGDREGQQIRKIVEQYWTELGFELVAEFDPVLGTFYQRLRAKATNPNARAALRQRMEKLERAAEVQLLAVPESQANLNNAQGLATLIQALANESTAAIQLGPLLLIKISQPDGTSQIYSRTLTTAQLNRLERNPELLKDPGNLLLALDSTTDKGDT